MTSPPGLEITEDLAFQRREVQVSRVASALFLLIAVAALAGLTGGGPLSDARAGATGA